jgi:predicted transcriptional regulator
VQTRITIPAGDISSDAHLVYSQLTDRGERIKTVLEAKPEATIKDISEIITDVSEKTIQRELNSLIEKGQVMRQGERRWSRYSIAR